MRNLLCFLFCVLISYKAKTQNTCSEPVLILGNTFSENSISPSVNDNYTLGDCIGSDYGNDYLYKYTPEFDADITISLNVTHTFAGSWGLFIYEDCPDSGSCVQYLTSSGANTISIIENIVQGNTYYFIHDFETPIIGSHTFDFDFNAEFLNTNQCMTDIVINTQTELDNFSCDTLMGSLTLDGDQISSLEPLLGLKHISQNLTIKTISATSLFGLDSLNSIGGNFVYGETGNDPSNPGLLLSQTPIDSITYLTSLDTILGEFWIRQNNHLSNIEQILSFEYISELYIYENPNLTNFNFLCRLDNINYQIYCQSPHPDANFCCAFDLLKKDILPEPQILIQPFNQTAPINLEDIYTSCLLSNHDIDSDFIQSQYDNCPKVSNPSQSDIDSDGVGDLCDNCPSIYNPDQLDSNNNFRGDACENLDDPEKRAELSNGDLFVNSPNGVILISPTGKCFRLIVSDEGGIITKQITCPQ